MPTRKVADLPQQEKCRHPEHEAAGMVVRSPGMYEHVCPACGHRYYFIVPLPERLEEPIPQVYNGAVAGFAFAVARRPIMPREPVAVPGSGDPIYCGHANENPGVCDCPDWCYCQTRTCKDRPEEARRRR